MFEKDMRGRLGALSLEAIETVCGPREDTYGPPEANLGRIAAMWTELLKTEITPQDVAACMVAVKLSRLVATPGHHDSIVDAIGYLMCYEEMGERDD